MTPFPISTEKVARLLATETFVERAESAQRSLVPVVHRALIEQRNAAPPSNFAKPPEDDALLIEAEEMVNRMLLEDDPEVVVAKVLSGESIEVPQ